MAVLNSVAKIVYGALKNEFRRFVILRTVETASETQPWKITQKQVEEHDCLGLLSSYKNYEIDNVKILKDDCKITILSLSIPTALNGFNNKTDTIQDPKTGRVWKIESTKTDPADATVRCQCR